MNKYLLDIINYAYNNSAFYKKLYDEAAVNPAEIRSEEDIVKLPIVTKSMIQNNQESVIAEEFTVYPKSSHLDVERTSGSTGKYLKVYWYDKDETRAMVPVWLIRSRKYKVLPDMRFSSFYSAVYKANNIVDMQEITREDNYLGFSKLDLTYEKMVEYYKMLIDFKPQWMMLQPSIAYMMAEIVKREKLPPLPGLRHLELTGEYLFDEYRKEIDEVFGIKSVNMYGSNETKCAAIELEDGKMHVIKENVFVEVLKDGKPVFDEEGDIYITSLTNHAMPVIRYETGDRGVLSDNNGDLVLDVKTGRVSEYILLGNGERLNSYTISGAMEYTNEDMQNVIKQYQAVQTGIDEFKMIIVIDPKFSGWKEAVEECFLENISKNQLANTKWTFEWTDMICPEADTGKYKFFKNEIVNR
ncbi:MAG: hypothetical protein K5884_09255 [Ruminococcus sp.]|nr:hypothetical protein [Ruminococcus sp.]